VLSPGAGEGERERVDKDWDCAAGGRSKEENAREEDKGARDKRTEEKGELQGPICKTKFPINLKPE
jgi:hypothetical protein